YLAMDFWAFIGKLSDREGGEFSDDQVLGVVIEGITDAEISDLEGGAKRTADDLRAMLAGVDIQGSEQSQVEMAPFPPSEPGSQRDEKKLWTPAKELATGPSKAAAPFTPENQATFTSGEQAPLPPDKQAPFTPEKQAPFTPTRSSEEERHATVLPVTPSPQLDETLLRLELTRLVQQYFDNIDKRISKLEPNPEGTGIIATAVTRRSLEEPVSPEEMEELRLRRTGRTRIVLEPAPSRAQDSHPGVKDDDDIPMRIPLEHYSPPERFGKAPLLLVLVLVGAAFAMYRDPTLLRKGFAAVVRQLHSNSSVTSSNPSAIPLPASSDQGASVKPEQSQSALEGGSTPPPANTPEQRTPSPQPTGAGSQPAENDSASSSGRNTATDRAVAQTERAVADGISSIEAAGAVRVNPSVMDENLIVQRVPAYPEVAKVSGVEGNVVMQALISKEGTVKRVHVMEGDSRLRSAAEEAVYKWRYRPYVLQGRPVEVATTVTVNFNLNRR
ncbi:MAG: hypothetical protein QOK38_2544, partial [Acidobacteriaceae bacterium]|nr:hypothetical protein [Acidobacteriaceae bacterium]